MDIQIKFSSDTGDLEIISGEFELKMELNMGLSVECLELNSGDIYIITMEDGIMVAAPAQVAS